MAEGRKRVKQQGNGSGTVYARKNKDGKITSYLGAYYTDGKKRYVSAKTKTECREKLRAAMSDADKGLVYDAGSTTVGQYLDKWLPGIKGTVRQRTWERYEQLVRIHIKPSLGQRKLKDLSRGHVKAFYGEKREALSPRTVQYVHVTLHKALKDAVADGLIHRNASDGLKPSSSRRHENHPLTPEQTGQDAALCGSGNTAPRPVRGRHPLRAQEGRTVGVEVAGRGLGGGGYAGTAHHVGGPCGYHRGGHEEWQGTARRTLPDGHRSSPKPPGAARWGRGTRIRYRQRHARHRHEPHSLFQRPTQARRTATNTLPRPTPHLRYNPLREGPAS